MRFIALDAQTALRDMLKVFHYAYIDEVTLKTVSGVLHTSIKEDLGHYVHVPEDFIARLLAQVVREGVNNYVDAVLKAIVHNEIYTIFEAIQSPASLSQHMHVKIFDTGTLLPMFNSLRPDMGYFLNTEHVMCSSVATALDRVKAQNHNNLRLKTFEFISQIKPQLEYEDIHHVIRTDLLDASTLALMVN